MKIMIRFVIVFFCFLASVFADMLINKPDGSKYEGTAYVTGLGEVTVADGHFDYVIEAKKRMGLSGRKVEIPTRYSFAIPPTNDMAGLVIEATGNKNINLQTEKSFDENYVLRIFRGPCILGMGGKPLTNAEIWADNTNMKFTSDINGMVQASFYVARNQTKLEVFIIAPGYDGKMITVNLPTYVSPDNPGKLKLTGKDIELKPVPYQVLKVEVRNPNTPVHHDKIKVASACFQKNGHYLYAYMLMDQVTGSKYGFSIDLKETETTNSIIAFLEKPFSWPNGKKVIMAQLPPTIPVVHLTEALTFVPANPTASKQEPRIQKQHLNPTIKILFIIIISMFSVALLFFILKSLDRIKQTDKTRKTRKENERNLAAGESFGYKAYDALVNRAMTSVHDDAVDSNVKTLLLSILEKINRLSADISVKSDAQKRIAARLNELKKSRLSALSDMKNCLNKGSYDLALSHKSTIEAMEAQTQTLAETKQVIQAHLDERVAACQALAKTLADICERAELSAEHTRNTADFLEFLEKIKATMASVKTVFEEDSTTDINVSEIERNTNERRKARNEGVTADDIDKLKSFLEERN